MKISIIHKPSLTLRRGVSPIALTALPGLSSNHTLGLFLGTPKTLKTRQLLGRFPITVPPPPLPPQSIPHSQVQMMSSFHHTLFCHLAHFLRNFLLNTYLLGTNFCFTDVIFIQKKPQTNPVRLLKCSASFCGTYGFW